jgi:PAS domain S-box-containing protein
MCEAMGPGFRPSEAFQSLERRALELIASGAPLEGTLDALCRVIDEHSGLMSAVYLLNRDGDQFSLIVGPHLPATWREATRAFRATPTSTACGAAVHQRTRVAVADVPGSPLFERLREAAGSSGIGSVWSTPFFSRSGLALGTFAVFAGEAGDRGEAHLSLIDRAAELAGAAVDQHLAEHDRKQAEEALRRSEQLLRLVLEAIPVGVAVMGHDGGVLLSNPASARIWGGAVPRGGPERYAASKGWWHDSGKRIERDEWASVRALAKGESSINEVIDIETFDGLRKIIQNSAVPIRDEDQAIVGAVVVNEDISAREAAEDAVRAQERRWRSVFDNSAIGFVIGDTALRIIASNRAMQELGGYSEHELTGLTFMDVTHPDDRHLMVEAASDLLAGRVRERQFENRYVRKNGDVIWIRATASMMEEPNEAPRYLALIENISARKAAEQELEHSLSHLRALTAKLMRARDDERRRIAQMLHETTAQDLAALKLLLAGLGRSSVALSDADRALLDESAELAERSMTGVRTLSYLLHPPFLEETGLLSAVRWYAKGFSDRSGIAVDLDLPSTMERLPQDVEMTVFRVVQEALINIHRHAQSATARIRLRADGDHLMLKIEDRGRGIAPDLLATVTTGSGAPGLGIAGMRERLEHRGGSLEVTSGDRGTTIRARVPVSVQTP